LLPLALFFAAALPPPASAADPDDKALKDGKADIQATKLK
jgi:hypothetical protein